MIKMKLSASIKSQCGFQLSSDVYANEVLSLRGAIHPKLLDEWLFLFFFFFHMFFCTSRVWRQKERIYSLATSIARKFHFGQCFDLGKGAITLYFTICPLPTSFTILLLKPEIAFILEILSSHIKNPESFGFSCWNNGRNGKQTRTPPLWHSLNLLVIF